jgi:hypothetical protein
VSSKSKTAVAKIVAAATYVSTHRKQLSTALALGAGLLEVVQKAS